MIHAYNMRHAHARYYNERCELDQDNLFILFKVLLIDIGRQFLDVVI